MEDFFDISELLYQKFLLDIYRHCDRVKNDLTPDDKEEMAAEMVDFIGQVVLSLEDNKPLIKVTSKKKSFIENLSKIVSKKIESDSFSKSVLSYYITNKKIPVSEVPSYTTIATISILSKGKRTSIKTLEKKIKKANMRVFRTASLLSPAVFLHQKMMDDGFTEAPQDEKHDTSFIRYIG